MSIYQDSGGTWRFRVVVKAHNGVKKRLSGTASINNAASARIAEAQAIKTFLSAPPVPDAPVSVTTFGDFVKRWQETYPISAQNKGSTVAYREHHIRIHLLPMELDDTPLALWPLRAIKAGVIERIAAKLYMTRSHKFAGTSKGKNLSPKTVKNVLQTLHKLLVSAHKWDEISKVPDFPKVRIQKPSFDFLTRQESDLLLSHVTDDEDRAKILVALRTGIRQGELIGLEWGDLDYARRIIRVRRSVYKGRDGSTKSHAERSVPMSDQVIAALKRIRHLRGDKVFYMRDGSLLTPDHLKAVLKRYLRAAGIRKVRWHDLRHSFASQLVMSGAHLKLVQEWLGHVSITTTMMYAHLAPDHGTQFVDMLDSAPKGLSAQAPHEAAE